MPFEFKPAVRAKKKLRLALTGPSGAGKTYTALAMACRMAQREGGEVAVIDSENGRALLFADRFPFQHLDLTAPYSPQRYVEAIRTAEQAGFAVIVIDSLSHAWQKEGGVLDIVERAKMSSAKKDGFGAWAKGTVEQDRIISGILGSTVHVIVTIRSKQAFEKDEETGKIHKLGMQPVQRDDTEYEFDLVGDMQMDHRMVITKSPIEALTDQVVNRPGAEVADQILDWLNSGTGTAEPRPAREFTPAEPPVRATTEAEAVPHANGTAKVEPPAKMAPIEFMEEAKSLGYLGSLSIAKAIGATAGNTPKEALLNWYNANGHDWAIVLKVLRNQAELRDGPDDDANEERPSREFTDPEQGELAGVGAAHLDPADVTRKARR